MSDIDLQPFLDIDASVNTLTSFLNHFNNNKSNKTIHRGAYVYGPSGSGKTTFVQNTLYKLGYDIVRYDAGEIRNKHIIHSITKENMSDKSVMGMFSEKAEKRNIAIVMDEIDGMNNGDKGGINTLIKLIRPKKTRKQRVEPISTVPIICIGNVHMDKKMKELLKVCVSVEITKPNTIQMKKMVNHLFPNVSEEIKELIVTYSDSDLQILMNIFIINNKSSNIITKNIFKTTLRGKDSTEDAKKSGKKMHI